jgi:hypothetical protein
MGLAQNGLALAPLRHEDTPLQHLQSAADSFAGHDQRVVMLATHCVERTDRRASG